METLNVKIEKLDGPTLTVLQGESRKVKYPLKVEVVADISAPYEFWAKRKEDYKDIFRKCHLLVDRQALKLILVVNEEDPEDRKTVVGRLVVNPDFEKFGINTSKQWVPAQLSTFFKMNRYFFPNKEDNGALVSVLNKFTGNINTAFEAIDDRRGNTKDSKQTILNSNIPAGFDLMIPLFVGQKAQLIKVEFEMYVDGQDVIVILVSPEAKETMLSLRDSELDTQVAKFADEVAVFNIS
jgi:hypothetical protein